MNKLKSRKTLLSTSILTIIGGVIGNSATAQDALEEEVVVTGIRGSLERAMDIKRDAKGVVDAISAEDIGKFPDSNLAESLQRITGVSIDRNNNEGNQVAVRGMAPEFNMVTLNGRTMPTATDDRNGAQNRAFNFAEIASESISGVDVFKTGKASHVTGGIGATIDIRTSRPLEVGERKLSGGFKAVFDQSNVTGEDVTPEISGLYSDVFMDGQLGVLASFSFQERHNREYIAAIDGWLQTNVGGTGAVLLDDAACAESASREAGLVGIDCVDNGSAETFNTVNSISSVDEDFRVNDTFYVPRNYNVGFADHERTRFNGNLVVQFAPAEEVTFTLDYVVSDFEDEIHRNQLGVWFANTGSTLVDELNENGTATGIRENGGTLDLFGFVNIDKTENESIGFNVEWDATDNLSLEFDLHNSTSEAGDDPQFGSGATTDQFLIVGYQVSQGFDIPQGAEIPTLSRLDLGSDGLPGTVDDIRTPDGNPDIYNASRVAPNLSFWNRNAQETEVTELRLVGDLALDNETMITGVKFGLGLIEHDTTADLRTNQQANAAVGEEFLPDGAFSVLDVSDEFSDFDGSEFLPDIFVFDTEVLIDGIIEGYRQNDLDENGLFLPRVPGQLHNLTEETTSLFVEFSGESEFDDFLIQGFSFLAGLRYESTDVTGSSQQRDFTRLEARSGTEIAELTDADVDCINEFGVGTTATTACREQQPFVFTDIASDYDYLLPSLDLTFNITDSVIGRISFSNTIARSDLVQQRGTQSVTTSDKNTFRLSEGNPGLLPYNSENFDVSLEWYYGDASYAAIGYFSKNVTDFLTTVTRSGPFNDLRDPFNGPRAEVAIADLEAANQELNDANIFNQMLANDLGITLEQVNAGAAPSGSTIISNDEDPIAIWEISSPSNGEDARITGQEVAVQHIFGESGFGVIANATFVQSDAEFDVSNVNQTFALTGLSDSANLVAFYDKNGFQARLAYNWRDEFLSGIGQLRVSGEPTFTEAFGQFDLNVSYDINDNFSVFVEGLNITEEDSRQFGRYDEQLVQAIVGSSRWNLGARAKF